MKPKKFFPFLLAVGLFLLVLGLLLLFRYAQARGSMMVLAFTVLGNLLGKWVSRQAEAHFWKNTFHHPPE